MQPTRYRWTVWYADYSHRDVTAFSRKGAMRTAKWAARLVGCKKMAARPIKADCLFPVGTNYNSDLLDKIGPEETPAELLDER